MLGLSQKCHRNGRWWLSCRGYFINFNEHKPTNKKPKQQCVQVNAFHRAAVLGWHSSFLLIFDIKKEEEVRFHFSLSRKRCDGVSILAEFILKLNSKKKKKKKRLFFLKLLIYIQLITGHIKHGQQFDIRKLIKNGLGHNTAAIVRTLWITEHADRN